MIKTMTWLNGGGLIAIPAIVTLFSIDANSAMTKLILSSGAFVFGLIITCMLQITAFFAIAAKSDREMSLHNSSQAFINKQHYYDYYNAEDLDKTIADTGESVKTWNRKFIRRRIAVIILTIIALSSFIAGSIFGGIGVIDAPRKQSDGGRAPITALPAMYGTGILITNQGKIESINPPNAASIDPQRDSKVNP